MDLNNCLDKAQKMASKAKNGIMKHGGHTYSFTFNHHNWTYTVEEDGAEYIHFNCKTLATAKQYLLEYLSN